MTAIDENPNDTSASLEIAMEVAVYFDLDRDEAREIVSEVATVTSTAGAGPSDGPFQEELDRGGLADSGITREEDELTSTYSEFADVVLDRTRCGLVQEEPEIVAGDCPY